jgi:hypothetical protein
LVGANPDKIIAEFSRVLQGTRPVPAPPHFWDGQAAKRIVQILLQEPLRARPWEISPGTDSAAQKAQAICS